MIGSGLRYFVNIALPHSVLVIDEGAHSGIQSGARIVGSHLDSFPWATFAVNVIGAFLIGVCAFVPIIADYEFRRIFVITGMLGGFTTFSALALDAVTMANPLLAFFYVAATFAVGLFATHIGALLARRSV